MFSRHVTIFKTPGDHFTNFFIKSLIFFSERLEPDVTIFPLIIKAGVENRPMLVIFLMSVMCSTEAGHSISLEYFYHCFFECVALVTTWSQNFYLYYSRVSLFHLVTTH